VKAPKNKTIDLSVEEGAEYLARCIRVEAPAALNEVLDRTILGDCLAVLPMLPRGFADLLIADPPYNLDKDFHGSRFSRMDDAAYEAYTIQWLDAALPCLKPDGSVYVCCDWRSGTVIGRVLESRLHVRNRITWQREKGRGAKKNWKNASEDIWFFTVSDDFVFNVEAVKVTRKVLAPYTENGAPKDWEKNAGGNFRATHPSNLWTDLTVPFWSMPENTDHPAQKPEKLIAKLILASTNPGDLVFDPFGGSGTTAVTAKKLGRNFTVIEQDRDYCCLALERLHRADADKTIQGYEDGVFWERNTAPKH
jgi:site-specific DNA-methyltransferase (adenine-specific)